MEIKIAAMKLCIALAMCSGQQAIVFEGDSLISTESSGSWPVLLEQKTLGLNGWHYRAKSGSTAGEALSRIKLKSIPPASSGKDVFLVNAGTNDILSGQSDAKQTYAALKQIWAIGRKEGYKVVAFTLHPLPCSAKCESERVKLNASIRSDPSIYDALVPLDTLFPSMDEPGMFTDRIHFDEGGKNRVVKAVMPILQKLKS